MSDDVVLDPALARSVWKSVAAVRLGACNAHLRWSKTPLQAHENLGESESGHSDAFGVADRAPSLQDDLLLTGLEHTVGNWGLA
jgi:hypothetical protein